MDSSKRPRDDGESVKEEIQLDLEAFTPTDSDIFGIQLLLQQLLRNVKGDTRLLADLVVKYNCGASIMKQVDDAEVYQEEDTAASGAATDSGAKAEAEQSAMDDDDSSAVLALFATLPRSERAVNELVRTLIGRLPKDTEYEKFASFANETESSLVVVLESIANFPPKISAAMCAQFVEADLSTSATQYAAYRSINHVLILRRALIHSDAEADEQSGSAESQRVELCFDEDHAFTEFATAVSGFEYAVATKNKQKRTDAETVGTKRKQSKRQDGSDDEESDEESTGGIALFLLTFEQFVAAVQKLKATYL